VTDRPEAISTNGELSFGAVDGGEPKRITANPGFDGIPHIHPMGASSRITPRKRRSMRATAGG